MGEGVLCLRDAVESRRTNWLTRGVKKLSMVAGGVSGMGVSSSRMMEDHNILSIDLSRGGKAMGKLRLKLRVGNKGSSFTSHIST